MGKAANRKKTRKATGSNNFNQLVFSIDINEICVNFLHRRSVEAANELYTAVAEHNFEMVKERLKELDALGVNIYDERYFVKTNNGEQRVEILQAALMFEDEEIFQYLGLDAVSKNSLSDNWREVIYAAPDASYLSPIRLRMTCKLFDAFQRHKDLLNMAPSEIEDMKSKMGPKAREIFDHVIGEKQAKLEQAELQEVIPDIEVESANDEVIVPRRRNSLRT